MVIKTSTWLENEWFEKLVINLALVTRFAIFYFCCLLFRLLIFKKVVGKPCSEFIKATFFWKKILLISFNNFKPGIFFK